MSPDESLLRRCASGGFRVAAARFGGFLIAMTSRSKKSALLGSLAERVGGPRTFSACSGCLGWPRRGVYFFMEDGEDALGMVLQDRTATPARLRYTHAMIAPTLQPFDRSAGTDLKAFGRLTSRRSRLHRFDNSLTQVTGQRFRHRRSPHRRINADRLAQPNRLLSTISPDSYSLGFCCPS
jgi:hypothetical protein